MRNMNDSYTIPDYINQWIKVIEEMHNDNTYKLSWGRSIIECVCFNNYKIIDNKCYISFDDISINMIKYYWNQLFFFNLKQSPYKDKNPVVCSIVSELIDIFSKHENSVLPVWFNEAEKILSSKLEKEYKLSIKKVSRCLHENVSWRFLKTNEGYENIYVYDKANSQVIIDINNVILIKEYSIILNKLLNFKWAQLLEKYNYVPNIASKVVGISENRLKRNDLSKYKNELLKEFKNKDILDFYTGEILSLDDISVDHVIPWSFMYSDDIWNLVLTSKSNNSKKSNIIPNKEIIAKLNDRNNRVLSMLSKSFYLEMKEAIENKYVDKYYYESRM